MHEEHGFNILHHIPVIQDLPNHVVMTALAVGVLIITTFFARVQLLSVMKGSGGGLIPEEKLTYRNFFEIVAESLYKLTESVIGHHETPTYFPAIGTLFVFIFLSNILGLIPIFQPATDNLNTTLALGVFVFLYYNYAGFKAHGPGYLKHFFGPVIFLAPLMLIIELASHLFRPLSLALRLRGNIMGDHIVMGVFSGLVPYLLPVVFYGLGVFVAFLQAFVFCLMTMVYISLSTSHDH
ncbi:MAG: F0F1 ATP synthase subunit A [Bdellovibrio sp.]|nr:F0F1 ATP synthase subunit A [Bdellovibrio sp.]